MADAFKDCRAKEAAPREGMDEARARNDPAKASALKAALVALKLNCRGEKPEAKNDLNWRRKELEVEERTIELQEAQSSGCTRKIAKREKKLKEAQEAPQ